MLLHAAPAFARHINLMIANDRAIYVLKLSKGSGGVCEKLGSVQYAITAHHLKCLFMTVFCADGCFHFPFFSAFI